MEQGFRASYVIVLAFVVSLIVPAASTAQSPAEIERELGPGVSAERSSETRAIRFIGTGSGEPIPAKGSAREAALSFLDRFAEGFGLGDVERELRVEGVERNRVGTTVSLEQLHSGVPVIAGELRVNLDEAGDILSVAGETLPDPKLSTDPAISAAEADDLALQLVAKHSDLDAGELEASEPVLSILDSRLLGGPGLDRPILVWQTEVTPRDGLEPVREFVAIEAQTGAVALNFDQIQHALNRTLCDSNNTGANVPCVAPIRTEGGPATGIPDADNAWEFTEDTYNFLAFLGHDSLNGGGMTLTSTTRYCDPASPCPFENAFWNGSQMVYGDGTTVDDVVGHELAHGFTEFTSGLLYYYQSGAINESISDVFGELVDLQNGGEAVSERWKVGEGSSLGVIRSMSDPTLFGHPDRMQSPHYFGTQDDGAGGPADNGGVHINSGVNNKAAYLMVDGGSFNGRTVAAIGAEDTARIYYRASVAYLTSGADYQNLADALRQSCFDIVGVGGITASDCAAVDQAVLATEMDQIPAAAPNVEAPTCTPTQDPSFFFNDNMEAGAGWSSGGNPPNLWGYTTGYATSGDVSLYAPDSNFATDSHVISPSFTVPANVPGGTWLRFSHGFGFEDVGYAYDGGVVEYSINGGAFQNAGPLFSDNGYNGAIDQFNFTNNPLGDDVPAFVNVSEGYISSRINLASLAGQPVRFRFRIATDAGVGAFPGWAIDDVQAYQCVADTTAPTATIIEGPANGSTITTPSPTVSFGFRADEKDASFQCSFDGRPFEACSSPLVTGALPVGGHSFAVRATDPAGNVGNADSRSFSVGDPGPDPNSTECADALAELDAAKAKLKRAKKRLKRAKNALEEADSRREIAEAEQAVKKAKKKVKKAKKKVRTAKGEVTVACG